MGFASGRRRAPRPLPWQPPWARSEAGGTAPRPISTGRRPSVAWISATLRVAFLGELADDDQRRSVSTWHAGMASPPVEHRRDLSPVKPRTPRSRSRILRPDQPESGLQSVCCLPRRQRGGGARERPSGSADRRRGRSPREPGWSRARRAANPSPRALSATSSTNSRSGHLGVAREVPHRRPAERARQRVGDPRDVSFQRFQRARVEAELREREVAVVEQDEVADALSDQLVDRCQRSG